MVRSEDVAKTLIISGVIFVIAFGSYAVVKNRMSSLGLPDYVENNPFVKQAYEFAKEHPEVVSNMPCYCGCANLGHRNNLDCFWDEDGSFVQHGSMCGGCAGVAVDAKSLYEQGKSLKEIREFIDEKYGADEFANPTPTPMVV